MADNIIKTATGFVDGRGYVGKMRDINLPDLAVQTEDYRAGGMDAPTALDMGMNALETSFVIQPYEAELIKLFGIKERATVPFRVQAARENDAGNVTNVVIRMRGRIVTLARGTWSPGSVAETTITMRLDYYQEEIDGEVVVEIDVNNYVRNIGGTDQLEAVRAALGI